MPLDNHPHDMVLGRLLTASVTADKSPVITYEGFAVQAFTAAVVPKTAKFDLERISAHRG